jgi:RNA polymerase sigma factor (sigma-70 family)
MPAPADGFAARLLIGPALRAQPDRRLVSLVRDGYEHAFEEIVRRYGGALTRYAAAIVGNRAEDVTQDAFSKALLAMRRDGREIELRPWLFRIVRNTALNELRDRPPSAETLAEAIAGGANPDEELERREELADLMRRLRALPDAQRAAIVMRELEGLSHEEIAAALGLSGGGARQAIFRARRALRDGAGMLLPLPLLKALLAGAMSAETAAGVAGAGSAVGAGMTIKAATATVLVVGAVGAGVAIDHGRQAAGPPEPAKASEAVARDPGDGETTVSSTGSESGHGSDTLRHGETEPGNDQGGERHSGESENSRHGGSGGNRGPGGGGNAEPGDDHGGDNGASRHGGDTSDVGGHSGRDSGSSSGSGSDDDSSGPSGGDSSGEASASGDSSGPGSDSVASGESSGSGSSGVSGSDSGSGSGGDGSGGDDSSSSGDSGDSGGGDGFSLQTEPQS